MDIILKEYVKGLGEKGDLVTVKHGYARNFLIPKGVAVVATKSAKKVVEENMRQAAHRQKHILDEAQKRGDELAEVKLVIETLAGIDGKLFGSVTPLMVENALVEKGFKIERKRINFPKDIKETGEYSATIDLHKEVKIEIAIEVIAKQS